MVYIRGQDYEGGPLPLWTTRRHLIITKEKHTQSYLVVTYSRRPVRHARSWPEVELPPPWRFLSVVEGEGALDVPIQHHPASPRELAGPSSAQELFHAQIA